jgi:hypothetical protein
MTRHQLSQLFRMRKRSLNLVVPVFARRTCRSSVAAKVVGWSSLAVGVAALGVIVGREIRIRYKFKRRTPYDYYAHSADQAPAADYGIGV